MEELQNLFIEKLLAPHERDFNLDIVYGAETDAQSVLGLCTGYPMMASRRVVVVRDFDRLKDNRLFTTFAERPNPSAAVLLLCSTKPNLTTHPYRALREHAVWGEFKPFYDNQIPGWIQQRVELAGYKIEPQAVQMLADYVGTNLRAVDAEIDKLITYAGGRKNLTGDDVIRAAGQTREYNVFELQRAIGQGRYADSVRILDRMLGQASNARGEALMIVTVLSSFFIKLWKLALAKDQNLPEKSLASHIGVSPYFLKEYLFSLRRFTTGKINRAFSALLSADYELKGGANRDERLILTLLMGKLVNGSVGDGTTGRILSS